MKFLLFSLLLLCGASAAAADDIRLAEDPQWLALVHYRPGVFSGCRGTIDSEDFYLAENGRTDPAAELEATVRLFAQGDDKDKICRFPARYIFLKNKGMVDKIDVKCEEFDRFKKDLRPAGATLLFTDAYMNNPSSLFGHTLLRIDTARKGTQLLAHGVSYGAFTKGAEGTLLYAVKGLAGGYYGGWTVKPYYDVINMYNNIENRDIWEMKLNFSPAELEMLVAHLWEVGHTRTRYYFFTKNCSYMLLEVLDAVRPEAGLAARFPLHAIPLDTAKAVYRSPGLVKGVSYRPSRRTRIVFQARRMTAAQRQSLLPAAEGKTAAVSDLTEKERAEVLETAYQYVQYLYVAEDIELAEYRRRSFALLSARSRLQVPAGAKEEKPVGRTPFAAHESMRVSVGAGSRNGNAFQEFAFRPAYHSLEDDDFGLLPGAEINFLNLRLRRYDRTDKTVLNRLDVLGIRSLSPADELFSPLSFTVSLALAREEDPATGREGYVLNGSVGAGKTVAAADNLYFYALAGVAGGYGGFLPRNQYAAIELTAGLFAGFDRLKLLAEAKKSFSSSSFAERIRYRAEAGMPLAKNWSLAAEYLFDDNAGKDNDEEFSVSVRYYF